MAKRSKEERAAWGEQMGKFASRIRGMAPEEREALALQYGTMTAEGHRLSPFNVILLAMQAGRACTVVGGFRQWGRAGRVVQRGENAIGSIMVPIGGKRERAQDQDQEQDATARPGRMRFRYVPMFAIEQTEPLEAATAAA